MIDYGHNQDVSEDWDADGLPRWTVTGKHGRPFDKLHLQFLCLSSLRAFTQGKQNANRWTLKLLMDGAECPLDMQVMASMKDRDRFLKAAMRARKRPAPSNRLPVKRERHGSAGSESVGSCSDDEDDAVYQKISSLDSFKKRKVMEYLKTLC